MKATSLHEAYAKEAGGLLLIACGKAAGVEKLDDEL